MSALKGSDACQQAGSTYAYITRLQFNPVSQTRFRRASVPAIPPESLRQTRVQARRGASSLGLFSRDPRILLLRRRLIQRSVYLTKRNCITVIVRVRSFFRLGYWRLFHDRFDVLVQRSDCRSPGQARIAMSSNASLAQDGSETSFFCPMGQIIPIDSSSSSLFGLDRLFAASLNCLAG